MGSSYYLNLPTPKEDTLLFISQEIAQVPQGCCTWPQHIQSALVSVGDIHCIDVYRHHGHDDFYWLKLSALSKSFSPGVTQEPVLGALHSALSLLPSQHLLAGPSASSTCMGQ